MRRFTRIIVSVIGCALQTGLWAAEPKVEEQPVGPAAPDALYVVSPKGSRLATVAHKGSRMIVVVDGEAGPKCDAIITPVFAWVDPRPYTARPGQPGMVPQPVTFSRDGSRYAYLGKQGEEWVLIADGKEALRMPAGGGVGGTSGIAGTAGNTDVRLEFTGESGKHLLFAKSSVNGYELWVDGQKWPGAYGSAGIGTMATDPMVSPDGERIAYMAQIARDKSTLLIDGKDAGYSATNLQWSPDGKHLLGLSQDKAGAHLLIDGKAVVNARGIAGLYLPPAGGQIIMAMMHQDPKTSALSQFLWVSGKPVETSGCDTVKRVTFSPDGKHYAAVCNKAGSDFVIIDGRKGQGYNAVTESIPGQHSELAFSSDSSKVGYTAFAGAKWFFVNGDDESDAYTSNPSFMFFDGGKHVVIWGQRGDSAILTIDGKDFKRPFNQPVANDFAATPDFAHYGYGVGFNPNTGGAIVIDNKETGLTGSFSLSGDGRHVAVVGFRAADNRRGLFIDDLLVMASDMQTSYRYFTADGKHIYWMTIEPNKAAGAPPGSFMLVTYLDDIPVARCERRPEAEKIVLPAGYVEAGRPVPGWSVQPDGTLTTFAVIGDAINRVKVTPPADRDIDAWLAEVRKAAESKPPKRK